MARRSWSFIIIALVCAVGWTIRGESQSMNQSRQTWEYKSISIARPVAPNGPFTVWAESDAAGTRTLQGTPDSMAKASELGAQGWELVSVTAISNHVADSSGFTSQVTWWFKRPK